MAPSSYFDQISEPIARRVAAGLSKIGLAQKSHEWHRAVELGITPTQGQTLVTLRMHPDTGLRLGEIADRLAITVATASDVVSALAHKGLVQKQRQSEDGRALAITLTDAGRREADRVASWSEFLLEPIATLTPAEREIVLRCLIKVIRALQERGLIPIARMCVTCQYFRPNVHPDAKHPHHCALVNAAFGDHHLRLECPEHVAASHEQATSAWSAFITREPRA